jgi:hypothetical protein
MIPTKGVISEDVINLQRHNRITELSEKYFGKVTCQTIMFFTLEHLATIKTVEGYKTPERVLRKFFKWQSKTSPKLSFPSIFNSIVFSHTNDLNWTECCGVDKRIRKEDKEKHKELTRGQKTDFMGAMFND